MIDWLQLPPLSALRAFSAYNGAGSVTKAGEALNVSHAAISQQIRALEVHLGVPLLDRNGRSMVLTAEGRELAQALEDGFGGIARTISALTDVEAKRPLQIACTQTFASSWLMPRLTRFQTAYPDLDMAIMPSPALTDPAPGGIDVAIRFGEGGWSGFDSVFLLPSPIVVVGAPELFPDGPPDRPEDLVGYPWLDELGTSESSSWFRMRGLSDALVKSRTQVPGNLMLDGVRNGQGIAVTTRIAVEPDIRSGRVLLLFEERKDAGYHLVTRSGVHRPPLKAFLRWITKEAQKT